VTPERLIAVLKSMRAGLLAKHGTLLNGFRGIDADKSGAISREELANELSSLQARVFLELVSSVDAVRCASGCLRIRVVTSYRLGAIRSPP
jgi:Ca2+-binding EF-hand superfamily protein